VRGTGLYTAEQIYRLLPAVYRVRDAEQGGVLRELVEIVADQVNALAESLDQMYDDQFIETCAEWVAPYIGDLIGYRTLHGVVPRVASPRAEVANTIRYRRRKGTASMLEQLARDVTGWPARTVEWFEQLTTTQYLNHVRRHAAATADLRDATRLAMSGTFQNGAFDAFAHTAEMRRVSSGSGRYNIPNIGIFLWRIQALPLGRVPLAAADPSGRRFRFDPLGTDKPLFGAPRTETDITHIAEPFDVPLPLHRRWLKAHVADYYGPGRSLLLETESAGGIDVVDASTIRVCDLSDDPAAPGSWAHEPQPADTHIGVDPVLGRVAFAAAPAVGELRLATFHYGAALAVGGGGYDRAASFADVQTVVPVSGGGTVLGPALTSVAGGGAVEIRDNREYAAPATITATTPAAGAADTAVTLRSINRARPLLARSGQLKLVMQPDATVIIDGLVLAGAPLVIEESADARPRTLILRHCTLVPGLTREPDGSPGGVGAASLIVLHPFASVTLDHCVTGPVVAVDGTELHANDSIVDAGGASEIAICGRQAPGGGTLGAVTTAADRQVGDGQMPAGAIDIEACTIVGKVHAIRMDVSNSILLAARTGPADPWPAPIRAERRQVGCIRFSFVPAGSRTPRRFRCAGADPAHVPHFTSLRHGDPAYMQLRAATHPAVRRGASDESEMGATHELYQPLRETNLRLRLDEYLRYGLEAGLFYAS
jgi:hypothetical protein